MEEQYLQETINPAGCQANGENMAVEGVREDSL
jgi:hypothetical protein